MIHYQARWRSRTATSSTPCAPRTNAAICCCSSRIRSSRRASQQTLRNIQEVLAEGEFRVGQFYHKKSSFPVRRQPSRDDGQSVTRSTAKADQALWLPARATANWATGSRTATITSYQRIVKDYPLSRWPSSPSSKLKSMEAEIPEPDPVSVARMKYEKENYQKPGMMHPFWGMFAKAPDTHTGGQVRTAGDHGSAPADSSERADTGARWRRRQPGRRPAGRRRSPPSATAQLRAATHNPTRVQNPPQQKKNEQEEKTRRMNRVLLADDSPNAQRMGERILREEGFEVVSVTDGETAFLRLADVTPDVILADAFLPTRSGFDLCRHIKAAPNLRHIGVVLTAGVLEPFDEAEARASGCDAILKKPFEASAVVETIKPLVEASNFARGLFADHAAASATPAPEPPATEPTVATPPAPPELDPERVRAAITIALDAALPQLVDAITERVLVALGH